MSINNFFFLFSSLLVVLQQCSIANATDKNNDDNVTKAISSGKIVPKSDAIVNSGPVVKSAFAVDDLSEPVKKWTNWQNGKQLEVKEAMEMPLVINPDGRVVINANVATTQTIQLKFSGAKDPVATFSGVENSDQQNYHMIIKTCVLKGNVCQKGVTFCFVGKMDPSVATKGGRFSLENYKQNNSIATSCEQQLQLTLAIGKVLHGFNIAFAEDKLLLTSSTSQKSPSYAIRNAQQCFDIHLGSEKNLDGFLKDYTDNKQLENDNDFFTELSYDILSGIPQKGGKIGIIAGGGACNIKIILVPWASVWL
ncbi:hypothetical protein niasHT_021893 [Heterodera trifolii]|uniref:Uncharacterized protein n=1 Tax=Heterodera trifolii TaxID=157864 RepID=A0ABD2K8X3_9BILA